MKMNRTTQRTVEILKLVSKNPEGTSLDEICGQLGLPKTSCYDIITTLAAMGMVNVAPGQKQKYTIGLQAYRIGMNYTNNLNFISVIEPELRAYARETGRTVFFGMQSDHEVVYITKAEPENPIITTATVGSKNPMYCTSLGKAILANLTPADQELLISRMHFKPRTANTILSREALKTELEKVQIKGYAMDFREVEEHMVCVGAPVFDRDGKVLGAISVSSLYRRDEDYEALGELTKQQAQKLSRLLGYIS